MLILLEDPDPKVYQQLRENIFKNIDSIKPYLEESRSLSSDTLFQTRLQQIQDEIETGNFISLLKNWAEREKPELIDALLIIEDAIYPEYDSLKTYNSFKTLRNTIWLDINNNLTAIEKVKVINKILYNDFALRNISLKQIKHQDLSLGKLFLSQQANSYMQCIFYASLAQHLGLPVYMISLPDLFILAYKDQFIADMSFANEQHYGVVFYIHPFESGALFSKNVIQKYIEAKGLEEASAFYTPMSNIQALLMHIQILLKSLSLNNITDFRQQMLKQMLRLISSLNDNKTENS